MMELIEAMRTNPMAALARFQVDASIGRWRRHRATR